MEKKKTGKAKKIILTILAILLVLIVIGVAYIAKMSGVFAPGNKSQYSVKNTESLTDSPLAGKKIIFLGSSVTFGSASLGESFVEFMEKRDGILPVKEAVIGTTLVDDNKQSYISRMKNLDADMNADAFVCQLSTNDASNGKEMGSIADGTSLDSFDTHTVAGAIEYIICYVKQTWNCPLIFYTGTQYDSEQYGEMVELLLQIQEKWDIGVIDLWNDAEMNAVSADDYQLYMFNGIHPTRAGYRDWWTPKFEAYLIEYLK